MESTMNSSVQESVKKFNLVKSHKLFIKLNLDKFKNFLRIVCSRKVLENSVHKFTSSHLTFMNSSSKNLDFYELIMHSDPV